MKNIIFPIIIAVALVSAHTSSAQNIDSAEKQHSPLIEGNGTSGSYGSNHNPDANDRKNNGTAVINDLKGSKTNSKSTKDSAIIHRTNATNSPGTKGSTGATSPQNSSSPK